MEDQKWLLIIICGASLIGGFATSLRILDGAGLEKASQRPALAAADSKGGWSDADLGIEHYYIKH